MKIAAALIIALAMVVTDPCQHNCIEMTPCL